MGLGKTLEDMDCMHNSFPWRCKFSSLIPYLLSPGGGAIKEPGDGKQHADKTSMLS